MASYGKEMSNTEEIIQQLLGIDIWCEEKDVYAEILILGGAALAILMEHYGSDFRPTRDIDLQILSTTNESDFRSIISKYEVDIIDGIVELPPNEDFTEGEKYEIKHNGFTNLKIYVPKIELLACSKIFTKREKDLQDLRDTDFLLHCNKDELLKLVKEYKDYAIMIESPDLNYHQLYRILEEKGI